ncbi:MAG: sugar ABC transporter permease [Treponemataceae bacterium]
MKAKTKFFDRHFLALLLVPTACIILLGIVFPLLYSLGLSLTNATLLNFLDDPGFIGIENFFTVIGDSQFANAFMKSVTFSLLSTGLEVIFGFMLALFVYSSIMNGRFFLIPCLLAPLMLTPAVVALMWKVMLDYQFGVLNYITESLGLGAHAWLGTNVLAFASIVAADVWQQVPFVFLIILAGLESMPMQPFEAARVDGANSWQTLRYLTIPFLRGPIFVAFLFRLIDSFKIFDKVSVLTGGGPGAATETLNLYMFRIGFQTFDFGKAAAIGQIIIFVIMALTWFVFRVMDSENAVEAD